MIAFSKYPYQFTNPKGGEPFALTPNRRCPVPDWVQETEMFQLAVSNGRIQVMKPKPSEKGVDLKSLREKAKALGISRAGSMGADKLEEAIAAKEQEQAADSGE